MQSQSVLVLKYRSGPTFRFVLKTAQVNTIVTGTGLASSKNRVIKSNIVNDSQANLIKSSNNFHEYRTVSVPLVGISKISKSCML